MKKVLVNGRIGLVSSIIPHRNGKYPVWFEDAGDIEFVERKDVVFIQPTIEPNPEECDARDGDSSTGDGNKSQPIS